MERIRNLLNIDLFEEFQNKKSSFSVVIMDSGIVLHPDFDYDDFAQFATF